MSDELNNQVEELEENNQVEDDPTPVTPDEEIDETTPWNYDVDGGLPPVITPQEFDVITGGVMSSSSDQIAAVLNAVSATIRAYCDWHVAPNVRCTWCGDADGKLVQLPAMNVTSVHTVKVDGQTLDPAEYAWRKSGLIRLARAPQDDWGQLVEVEFDAGVSTGYIASIASQLATNALVAPAGVLSERAGDVSIQYNSTASGVAGGIRLLESDKEALNAFKLPQGV